MTARFVAARTILKVILTLMRFESCKRSFGRELERSRMSLAPMWSCATEASRDSCWVADLQIVCMRSLDGKLSCLLGGRSVGIIY